jgi:hypothetical protein
MSETVNNKKNIARHILPTSANLSGLYFVILSFIKVSKLGNETIIDELVVNCSFCLHIQSWLHMRQ